VQTKRSPPAHVLGHQILHSSLQLGLGTVHIAMQVNVWNLRRIFTSDIEMHRIRSPLKNNQTPSGIQNHLRSYTYNTFYRVRYSNQFHDNIMTCIVCVKFQVMGLPFLSASHRGRRAAKREAKEVLQNSYTSPTNAKTKPYTKRRKCEDITGHIRLHAPADFTRGS
jgi:hypothetical protein